MLKPLDHGALPLAGYTAPWIAKAGTQLTVHVSAKREVEKIRVVRLDLPDGPEVDWLVTRTGEAARSNVLSIGSWLRIAGEEIAALGQLSSITMEVLLTRNSGQRCLLDLGRVALSVSDCKLALCIDGESVTFCEVPSNVWMTLRLELAAPSIMLSLEMHDVIGSRRVEHQHPASTLQMNIADIVIGSDAAESVPSLNARYGLSVIR